MSKPVITELKVVDGKFELTWEYEVELLEPDGDGYIYNEGIYEDKWVEGYSTGTGSQSKEEDSHLYLYAKRESADAERTYVTDKRVDLTDWDDLKIEWENTASESDANFSYLAVSTNKSGDSGIADERINTNSNFTKTTDTMNVSGLSGSYYIRVHATALTLSDIESELKVYKVWLEEDE